MNCGSCRAAPGSSRPGGLIGTPRRKTGLPLRYSLSPFDSNVRKPKRVLPKTRADESETLISYSSGVCGDQDLGLRPSIVKLASPHVSVLMASAVTLPAAKRSPSG